MARTKRLRRLRAELWLLEESQEGLTVRELASQLEVSTRTAQRDLQSLRASGYPLSSVGARWRFVEGQALPTALAADGANQAPERDRVMILDRAIRQRRPVNVAHWSPGPGGPIRFCLSPLQLKYLDGSLFLVASEHPSGLLRTLAVERLAQIRPTRGRFPKSMTLRLKGYPMDRMRADALCDLVRVILRFGPAIRWRVTERIWHPSQRVALEEDGSATVIVRVPGFAWVRAWVLGFGADVMVTEPPELVREICDELERTRARYVGYEDQLPQLDLFDAQK